MVESNGRKIILISSVKMTYVIDLHALLSSLGYETQIEYILTERQYRKLKRNTFTITLLRLCTYLVHPVFISIKSVFFKKSFIVVATSNSFINPLALLLSKKIKRFSLISYIYDLHPEASFWSDKTGLKKVLYDFGRLIQGFQSSSCDKVILMEQGLLKAFKFYYPNVKSEFDTARIMFKPYPGSIDFGKITSHKLTLHYGGQLGRMHNPIQFAEFINTVSKNSKYLFDISIPRVNHYLFNTNVDVFDSRSFTDWEKFMLERCDIGIVSLSEMGSKVCFPSKMLGYINYGIPVLAIAPKNSDLANLIVDNSIGWVIHWDLPKSMEMEFTEISNSWEELDFSELKRRVLSFRDSYLNLDKLKEDWLRILK